MNELQIRLGADISALQSALTKAKQTIKKFEGETNRESERGNVGFKRKIGLIENLTNKAKQLRVSLSKATNEKDIERYNQELAQTTTEMTRLNALGRTLGSSATGASQGFNKLAKSQTNANGVAIEFSRIIQDAPFGIVGIGNNLQQLTANFAQVSKSAGGAGAAIKASLASLVSPANLLVLGISAVTAAFTAYQMGAFDSLFATEDLAKASEEAAEKLEKYRNTLDAVSRANIEGAASGQEEARTFEELRLQAENANIPLETRLEAVKELQSKYPAYLGNLTDEQILTGNVGDAYSNLSKQIIATAKARAASNAIAENSLKLLTLESQATERAIKIAKLDEESRRITGSGQATSVATAGGLVRTEAGERLSKIEGKINDLIKEQVSNIKEINSIKLEDQRLTESINKNISEGAKFTETQKKETETLNEETKDLLKNISEKGREALGVFTDSQWQEAIDNVNRLNEAGNQLTGDEGGDIEDPFGIMGMIGGDAPIDEIADTYVDELDRVQLKVSDLSGAFTGLGAVIGKSFDNPQLGSFLGQFTAFVTKVVAGAFAVSKANAIAGATQSSLFTGPAAAFTLPAFIAGAIGLVTSAFASIGGGGGGGGGASGASSGAPPQIFTNANTIPQAGSDGFGGSIDASNAQSRLFVDIDFDKLRFFLDQGSERRKWG